MLRCLRVMEACIGKRFFEDPFRSEIEPHRCARYDNGGPDISNRLCHDADGERQEYSRLRGQGHHAILF